MALTSGPSSPEFSSFEPVATTNMVSEYTGDFTYNIPVINIPGPNNFGYALSLSYHSGENVESEASWVGYGWTLNPGAINRIKRGVPDDANGLEITKHNETTPNWTVSVTGHAGSPEMFSVDLKVSAFKTLRYNNYKGFGSTNGINAQIYDGLSLGYSVTDGTGSFSVRVSPVAILYNRTVKKKSKMGPSQYENLYGGNDNLRKQKWWETKQGWALVRTALDDFSYNSAINSNNYSPCYVSEYKGFSLDYNASIEFTSTSFPVGPELGVSLNVSSQWNISETKKIYGYLYTHSASPFDILDYTVEKDNPFQKRDLYLPIPYSLPDQYLLLGEGVGGSFKLHNKQIGHYAPPVSLSEIEIKNKGIEFQAGGNIGSGADQGIGFQTTFITYAWKEDADDPHGVLDYDHSDADDVNENYFFRFNNDLGGSVTYGTENYIINASLDRTDWSERKAYLKLPTSLDKEMESDYDLVSRSGRSSMISYNTFSDLVDDYTNNIAGENFIDKKYYKAYDKSESYYETTSSERKLKKNPATQDQIGEFSIARPDGSRMTYGIAVLAQKEKNLTYGIHKTSPNYDLDDSGSPYNMVYPTTFDNNDNLKDYNMKVGEEMESEYVTTHLLTMITSPNYVDITMNGPTDDDIGDYVKFNYVKKYGKGCSEWYNWRAPYTGLVYNPGNYSWKKDNTGSYSQGEKEVYYLESIETKTHKANFIINDETGDPDREDGIDALETDRAMEGYIDLNNRNKLFYLKQIELYAKNTENTDEKLLKTVYFQYNYELCGGTLNSNAQTTDGDITGSVSQGKLTLKKMWFEYGGIKNARISPYEFHYEYPSSGTYPSEYAYLEDHFDDFDATDENPNYTPSSTDPWGYYRPHGSDMEEKIRTGVDQTPNTTNGVAYSNTFDPAAWQLKRISLPSGGEIHIQYEQDEYAYVQDRKASILVPLDAIEEYGNGSNNGSGDENKYTLDLSDFDISNSDLNAYKDTINSIYSNKKIYFKFLYDLGTDVNDDWTYKDYQYIDGYVKFDEATVSNDKIIIDISGSNTKHEVPNNVCHDYCKTHRIGSTGADLMDAFYNGIQTLATKMLSSNISTNTPTLIDPEHSYFKIPVFEKKLGGGLRVKRLIMYDKGLESGDKKVYGKEYYYVDEDGNCSGVASNEPLEMREENALVDVWIKRESQTGLKGWWDKATSGRDKTQFEGPWGENILPTPTVGYSSVIISDIRPNSSSIETSNTANGFIVKEFYTTKDAPFDGNSNNLNYTAISSIQKQNTPLNTIDMLLLFIHNEKHWATQGYRFIKFPIEGHLKKISTYPGMYSSSDTYIFPVCSSTQSYEYFWPGETVPVMYDINDIKQENPGLEVEFTMEKRKITDRTNKGNIEADFSIGFVGPAPTPFLTGMGRVQLSSTQYSTHVTSKVMTYPVIQKSVSTEQDGIKTTTENIAFDRYTGLPVITKTYDEFDGETMDQTPHNGAIVSYNIPASYKYSGMGQKAISEGLIFEVAVSSGVISIPGCANDDIKLDYYLSPGDLVKVGTIIDYIHINTSGDYVLENNPSYSTTVNESLEIIHSGKANLLTASTMKIKKYGVPYHLASSSQTISTQNALDDISDLVETTQSGSTGSTSFSNAGFSPTSYSCCDSTLYVSYDPSANNGTLSFTSTCGDDPCYITSVPSDIGFYVDYNKQKIYYYDASLTDPCLTEVTCLKLCPREFDALNVGVTTYDYNWPWNETSANNTKVLSGTHGKWRVESSYVYNTTITPGGSASANEKIYDDAGCFNFTMFDWSVNPNNVDEWLKVSEVTKYNPHGNAVEEVDVLGIYATAKYGYKNTKAYLVAANAQYDEVQFESFENTYESDTKFEDDLAVNSIQRDQDSHAGKYSAILESGNNFNLKSFEISQNIYENGIILKTWVKIPKSLIGSNNPLTYGISNGTNSYSGNMKCIARTGEWALFSVNIDIQALNYAINDNVTVSVQNTLTQAINIDDIRLQPSNAQMSTYVYDNKRHLLLCSFDDQHFGSFYQYNAEGKLIRKIIETKDGMKTIQETHYHTNSIIR
jgi:hypothetical protein